MGPGLAAPAKNASTEGRGGRVIVGRVGGDAVSASEGLVVDMFFFFFAAVGGFVVVRIIIKTKRKIKIRKKKKEENGKKREMNE
jgi:fucose permease